MAARSELHMGESCCCLSVQRVWPSGSRNAPIRTAFERGLGPITLGILFHVGLTVLRTADHSVVAYLVSAVVCAFMLFTRLSPLYFMAVAGVLGAIGIIPS